MIVFQGTSNLFVYNTEVCKSPNLVLKSIRCWIKLILPRAVDLHSVDTLSNHAVNRPANSMLMNRSEENNLNPEPNGGCSSCILLHLHILLS